MAKIAVKDKERIYEKLTKKPSTTNHPPYLPFFLAGWALPRHNRLIIRNTNCS